MLSGEIDDENIFDKDKKINVEASEVRVSLR